MSFIDSEIKANKNGRQYLEMLHPAKERLAGRDPQEIAAKTGMEFDGNGFHFKSLGRVLTITYPEYDLTPVYDEWLHLIVLHYMDIADGTPIGGEPIAFGSMKGGLIRGAGFDRESEKFLSGYFGEKPEENVAKLFESLGGQIFKSNADLSAVFYYLPRFPVMVKLWFADDEIGGSGRMWLDESADGYLTVEDAVTVGEIMLELFEREYNRVFE